MFLDRCDICHKPKKCKGYEGKVLCEECISKLDIKPKIEVKNEVKSNKKDITIFDYL